MTAISAPGDGENYKIICKELSDLGRQIEAITARCHSVQDLFASELLGMRYKFRELCETLLCGAPQFYGRMVREKLWRHAYYDVVCRTRRMLKDKEWDSLCIAYITQHLFHGIGHLNVVLMKFEDLPEFQQSKFPFKPNSIDNILPAGPHLVAVESTLVEVPRWLSDLIYIILINIGDLYRYLNDIYSKRDEDQAETYFNRAKDYYAQAFVLFPESGFAMNQIGNLSVKLNGGIDTTYYMLHSMLSTIAYEGAALNLQHHLGSCLVQFATLPGTHESKPIEVFCNGFITQIHDLLYENVKIPNFGKGIADLIVNFQERLTTYDPDLDERFLFRISSICVLTFWQLQAQNSPNISFAVALATAMFSQLLTQLGLILEQHSQLQKIESSPPISPAISNEELHSENLPSVDLPTAETHSNEDEIADQLSCDVVESLKISLKNGKDDNTNKSSDEAGEKMKKKKNVMALRRRRRVFKNMIPTSSSDESDQEYSDAEGGGGSGSDQNAKDDSDSEFEWSSDSENYSDSDEEAAAARVESKVTHANGEIKRDRAFGSSSSSQSRSDTSGNSAAAIKTFEEPPVLEFASSGKNSTQSNCSNGGGDIDVDAESHHHENNVTEKFVIPVEELRKCRAQLEPLMVAVLPFVRWLQVSPEIKDAFAANCGKEYVVGMCNMFNLLGSQNWAKKFEGVGTEVVDEWKKLGQSQEDLSKMFQWQLPEDRSMLGLPKYESLVKELRNGLALNENELLVGRMARILLFGHWLVETKSFSMTFDEERREFKYESPKAERNRERIRKIKRLMDMKSSNLDALTKAYRACEGADGRKQGDKRGKSGRGGERRRRGGRNNRREGSRNKDWTSVVFIVVDLPAVLYHLKNVQKLANKRRFVVVLPKPVWKAIDDMKERKDGESEKAKAASYWLKSCNSEGHRGVRCLRDHEKMPIDYDYPRSMDQETLDFFMMMETCKYLLTHDRDEKPSSRTFFGDMRDKFRVICLSGYKDLLAPTASKDFNPITLARVVGTFVDLVAGYPPNHQGRRKWKGSKSNG